MDYATITISGSLLDRWLPKGATYAGHCTVTRCVTVDADVIRQIDAAEAGGVRRILLVVDSFGGYVDSAYAMAARLERYRAAGGFVVSFVQIADSSAPLVAVSADYVVIAADGRIAIHRAGRPGDDAQHLHREMAEALARRTGESADFLVACMDEADDHLVVYDAACAVRRGFADEIGTLERARELAAGAARPETVRSRKLAALLPAVACLALACGAEVMSSESGFIGRPYRNTDAEMQKLALRNWSSRTIPAGGYKAIAWAGVGFVAVGTNVSATSTYDGEVWTARSIPSGTYRGVAWNGTVTVAVGSSVAASSTDAGASWTTRTIPAGTYYAVTWSDALSLFVAVGASVCATSPDGQAWTSRTIPSGTYYGVAASADVVVAVGASSACASSTNGTSWSAQTITSGTYYAVTRGDLGFVAVGDASAISSSLDGAAWTTGSLADVGSRILSSVAWTGLVYVAIEVRISPGPISVHSTTSTALPWEFLAGSLPNSAGYAAVACSDRRCVAVNDSACAVSLLF